MHNSRKRSTFQIRIVKLSYVNFILNFKICLKQKLILIKGNKASRVQLGVRTQQEGKRIERKIEKSEKN